MSLLFSSGGSGVPMRQKFSLSFRFAGRLPSKAFSSFLLSRLMVNLSARGERVSYGRSLQRVISQPMTWYYRSNYKYVHVRFVLSPAYAMSRNSALNLCAIWTWLEGILTATVCGFNHIEMNQSHRRGTYKQPPKTFIDKLWLQKLSSNSLNLG